MGFFIVTIPQTARRHPVQARSFNAMAQRGLRRFRRVQDEEEADEVSVKKTFFENNGRKEKEKASNQREQNDARIAGGFPDWLSSWNPGSGKCGPGVWDRGDEIELKRSRKVPLSAQISVIVMKAQEKGWTYLYVYKEDGKTPDMQLAMAITQQLVAMGLSGKMSCCLDPQNMPPIEQVCKRHRGNADAGHAAEKPAAAPVPVPT